MIQNKSKARTGTYWRQNLMTIAKTEVLATDTSPSFWKGDSESSITNQWSG